jgi:glutathione synthase/RimK-type ligase-like ATP-grasp enzyme
VMKAVVFKSQRRAQAFEEQFRKAGVEVVRLDFDSPDWVEYDFQDVDFVVYFPEFQFTSNNPLALYAVYDNLMHIHALYPTIRMFPDPKIIRFYSDKYRQYLFLRSRHHPYPETYALVSEGSLDIAENRLGYPLVVKNRYGAGGDYVFRVDNRKQLREYYDLSTLNYFSVTGLKHALRTLRSRLFYYYLIREKRMAYPFLSMPLLAQKFVPHDRDIKTVVGQGRVVEAHWRRKADDQMWKVNIDGGGIGEWSYVPPEIIDLSERLAADLQATWLNIDIIQSDGRYLISEFSPVWHHYAYREKPNFVYKGDYNIDVPLDIALNLERIIVESFVAPKAPA